MTKAIFIDRDGTINHDNGYVHKIEDFKFMPKVPEGLKLLSDYKLFIITNQSGISRGLFSEQQSLEFTNNIIKELSNHNIKISGLYYCPHHPDDNCRCRKPKTGLIEKAAKEHNINLKNSFVIGDMTIDIEMGKKVGANTILVLTGKKGEDKTYVTKPNFIAKDMLEAAIYILKCKK